MSQTTKKDAIEDSSLEIQKEIKDLENRIQSMEDTDPDYMGEPVKRLRHYSLYVHQKIEQFIGRVQTVDIIMSQSKLLSQEDAVKIYLKMEEIFNTTEYGRLLKVAEAKKILPDGFSGIAFKINDARLAFAHPRAYAGKLQEFRNPEVRLALYKDLVKAMHMINDYYVAKQRERDTIEKQIVDEVMSRVAKRIKTEGLKNSAKILEEELDKQG